MSWVWLVHVNVACMNVQEAAIKVQWGYRLDLAYGTCGPDRRSVLKRTKNSVLAC